MYMYCAVYLCMCVETCASVHAHMYCTCFLLFPLSLSPSLLVYLSSSTHTYTARAQVVHFFPVIPPIILFMLSVCTVQLFRKLCRHNRLTPTQGGVGKIHTLCIRCGHFQNASKEHLLYIMTIVWAGMYMYDTR